MPKPYGGGSRACASLIFFWVGRADGRTGGRADGRTGGRAAGRTGGRADGRTGGRADGRAGGRADGRASGRAGGRADGRTVGRIFLKFNFIMIDFIVSKLKFDYFIMIFYFQTSKVYLYE